MTFLENCLKSPHRDLFSVLMPGGQRLVVLGDIEHIKPIFKESPPIYLSGKFNAGFKKILGNHSLFVVDDDEHLKTRKLIMPAFHGEAMQSFAIRMLDLSVACAKGMSKRPSQAEAFSVLDCMQDLTLDMILTFIFDVQSEDRIGRFNSLREKLAEELKLLNQCPWLFFPILQKAVGRFSPWSRFLALQKEADALIYELIQEQREAIKETPSHGILSHLLHARDEKGDQATDIEIRDHLMTLLIAGHETTSTALAWAFRWILGTPGVKEELKRRLDGIWKTAEKSSPEALNQGSLSQTILDEDYLDAVIKESLRLIPIIPGVGRELKEDLILDNYRIPAGTIVSPCSYLVHRNVKYYKNPHQFIPERFMESPSNELKEKHSPFDYFPFGGGRRRCVGMAFSLYEMKMIIAAFIHHLDLELEPDQNLQVVRKGVTLAPASGTRVKQIHECRS